MRFSQCICITRDNMTTACSHTAKVQIQLRLKNTCLGEKYMFLTHPNTYKFP